MNVATVVKEVGGIAVELGAGMIAGAACGMVAPVAGVGLITKGLLWAGTTGIAGAVGEQASDYFTQQVEKFEEAVDSFKAEFYKKEKAVE